MSCRLVIMEDESRDVLVKLIYVQRSYKCFCIASGGAPQENTLMQFQLSQTDLIEIRKTVRAHQTFAMHVHLAFDNGEDLETQ